MAKGSKSTSGGGKGAAGISKKGGYSGSTPAGKPQRPSSSGAATPASGSGGKPK